MRSSLAMAIPALPAPLMTTRQSSFSLSDYLQRVDDARKNDDGGAVLVVMEHRNIQRFFQPFFNFKAAGGADVFQIDAAEAGSDPGDGLDDFLRILGVQADRNGVDVRRIP